MAETIAREQHLLPTNATPPEKALAALGAIVHRLDDPIATMWDAWTCPSVALPFLAWALRVPLWDEAWPETKKRAVIAESPDLNAHKCTTWAMRRYVEIMGGEVADIVLPPSGIYLGGGDAADHRRWLEQFAEVRLYDRPGEDTIAWDFAGEAYFEDGSDDGLYCAAYLPRPKRRAELHDNGIVQTLELFETRSHSLTLETRIVETLFGSGVGGGGYFCGEAFEGDALMPLSPVLFMEFEGGLPLANAGRTGIDARLISDRPEKVIVSGEALEFFLDEDATTADYLAPSIADRMIYETLRLYDPSRSNGVSPDGYCIGDPDLFHLPECHMLVDIDAGHPVDRRATFAGGYEADFFLPDDGAWRARLYGAAASANPSSDKTLATSALHRAVRFSDGLPFGSFSFGDLIHSKEHTINA